MQQNNTDQVESEPSFVVVVAIDFGTTSSGYAYAFTKEPECIHTMRYVGPAVQTLTEEDQGGVKHYLVNKQDALSCFHVGVRVQ